MRGRFLLAAFLLACLAWLGATPSGQQQPAPGSQHVAGEILVRFRTDTPASRRESHLNTVGGRRIRHFNALDLDHVRIPAGARIEDAVSALRASGDVLSAQPNYTRRITGPAPAPPNDFFWTNDLTYGFYGMKKIRADQTWLTYTTGSSDVIVADIDTGVKYTHPDLAANMWTNPGEIPGNGIDDDANGYVDDIYGIDTYNNDSNPMDDNGHGTHTAGTFGAIGNNGPGFAGGTGVVGVNWTVKILACKFLNAAGNGSDAGAIGCLNYITALKNRGINIRVSSNSWGSERGGGPVPQVLKDAIDAAGNAGIINIFAAGNGGADNIGDNIDNFPFDPASLTSPSIVSVAASDSADNRAGFSNFGATSVDLAAPGVAILSTWIGASYTCYGNPCGYQYSNGTSMAAPHVAGAAALLLAQQPSLPVSGIKSLLLSGATPVPAWSGFVASGGRLDTFNAANAIAANTAPSVSITSPAAGANYTAPASVTLSANATDATGTVASVEFFANAMSLGTDTSSPFSITSLGVPAGNYQLTAKATDNLGSFTVSAPVAITVTSVSTPALALSADNLIFGKQRVGTTSTGAQSVTVTNYGPGTVVFASFNGAAPAASFSVGEFPAQTDCPLTPAGLPLFASCTFTFQFSPTAVGPRAASLSIGTNALGSPHALGLGGTGFIIDEPTVSQTIASGGTRQQALQVADGGWYFKVTDTDCDLGPGVSCPNILGTTALSLLSAYERNGNPATLAAAVSAGNRLLAVYNSAPTLPPFSQDLEFLVALSDTTNDPQYANIAATWFQTISAAYPNAADRVDLSFTRRNSQGLRTLAVWDVASLIRSAKAVGAADYALAAAVRVRDREAEWKDVDPTHRWDQCEIAAGCGPADNPRAYSYTLIGMGSLLWAIHDLPGFDLEIPAYRAHLLSTQGADGSWDVGDLQITSYVVMGLGAVGGAGTDAAIQSAVAFFISNQLPSNGWPYYVTDGVAGGEYTTVNAEVTRAVATLFSTQAGQGVQVSPAQLSTVTFTTVAKSGATTVVARQDQSAAKLPPGYTLVTGLSYEVATSAVVHGHMTVCVAIPWAATAGPAADIRLLHREHKRLLDRTILKGPLAPTSTQVCAAVTSLDGFAVARRQPRH